VVFCDWLLSLSTMFWRFILSLMSYFIMYQCFIYKWAVSSNPLVTCWTSGLCPPFDCYETCCSEPCLRGSMWTCVFISLEYTPRSRTGGSIWKLCLTFRGTARLLSKMSIRLLCISAIRKCSSSSTLMSTLVSWLFNFSYPNGSDLVSQLLLLFAYPWWLIGHLFTLFGYDYSKLSPIYRLCCLFIIEL
jgi:hypothetical protein